MALTPLGCLGEEATFVPGQSRGKATLGYDTIRHLVTLVALYDDQAAVEEQLAANPPSGTEE